MLTRNIHEIIPFYPLSLALMYLLFVTQKKCKVLCKQAGVVPCVFFSSNKILNKLLVNIAVLAEENASVILRLRRGKNVIKNVAQGQEQFLLLFCKTEVYK